MSNIRDSSGRTHPNPKWALGQVGWGGGGEHCAGIQEGGYSASLSRSK